MVVCRARSPTNDRCPGLLDPGRGRPAETGLTAPAATIATTRSTTPRKDHPGRHRPRWPRKWRRAGDEARYQRAGGLALGLGCMGMSGMYGPADARGEHRDHPRRARCRHRRSSTPATSTAWATTSCSSRGPARPPARAATAERQVRRPARARRRVAGLRRAPGRGQDCAGLHAQPAGRRAHRHLPPGAPATPRCRSRRRSAPSPSSSRPATSRTSGSPRWAPRPIRRAAAAQPICDLQIEYSLISRGIEEQILPTCRELGIGVTAYGVLSRGLISGHFAADRELAANDFRAAARASPRRTASATGARRGAARGRRRQGHHRAR